MCSLLAEKDCLVLFVLSIYGSDVVLVTVNVEHFESVKWKIWKLNFSGRFVLSQCMNACLMLNFGSLDGIVTVLDRIRSSSSNIQMMLCVFVTSAGCVFINKMTILVCRLWLGLSFYYIHKGQRKGILASKSDFVINEATMTVERGLWSLLLTLSTKRFPLPLLFFLQFFLKK